MGYKNILIFGILVVFFLSFFFKVIPIPVSTQSCMMEKGIENCCVINLDGIDTHCGIYWTSGLYQLDVNNYLGFVSYLVIILALGGLIILI